MGGNLNNSGMLIPYMSSYFYQYNNKIRSSDLLIIGPISFIVEAIVSVIAVSLSTRFLLYDQILVGSIVSCLIIFLSTYVSNAFLFCCIYGLGLGYLSGVAFLPSLIILWNQLPKNKAKYTGIALFGYVIGITPFGIFFTMVVNPNNDAPVKIESDGEENETMYPKSVSERVPMTIRLMTIAFLAVSLLGLALVPRAKQENHVKEATRTLTLKKVLKDKVFWNLFFLSFNAFSAIAYIHLVYKIIGNVYIRDDYFTSFVGSVAFALGGFGRLAYGYFIDTLDWKRVFGLTFVFYMIFSYSFWFTIDSKEVFGFYVVMFTFLSASFYNGIASESQRAFPKDNWIMSYIGLAYTPAYIIPYLFEKLLTPYIGYGWTLMIVSIFPTVALLQVLFHPRRKIEVLVSHDEGIENEIY